MYSEQCTACFIADCVESQENAWEIVTLLEHGQNWAMHAILSSMKFVQKYPGQNVPQDF